MNYTTHTPITVGSSQNSSLMEAKNAFESGQGELIKVYENVTNAFDAIKKRAAGEIPDLILNEGATTFAQYAAIRSNPGAGNFRMYKGAANKKALMNRPILKLSKLVKEGSVGRFRVQAADENAYKDGYKFKVVNTKLKSLPAYKYTNTKAEANEAAKIHSRGLLRASWGANLPRVGARIPNAVQYVFEANPDVKKFAEQCMDIKVIQEQTSKYIKIWNRAPFDVGYKNYIKGVAEEMGNRRVHNLLWKDTHFHQMIQQRLRDIPLRLMSAQSKYDVVNSFWTGALNTEVNMNATSELNSWFSRDGSGISVFTDNSGMGFRMDSASVTFSTFGRSL